MQLLKSLIDYDLGDAPDTSFALQSLLLRIEGVFGVLEELVLQLEAFVVGLDGLDCLGDLARPLLLIELAEFLVGGRRVACIVIGEPRVPPDAGVDGAGQVQRDADRRRTADRRDPGERDRGARSACSMFRLRRRACRTAS